MTHNPIPDLGLPVFSFPPKKGEVIFAINVSLVENLTHAEILKLISQFNLVPTFKLRHNRKTSQIEFWIELYREIHDYEAYLPADFMTEPHMELSHAIEPSYAVALAYSLKHGRAEEAVAA